MSAGSVESPSVWSAESEFAYIAEGDVSSVSAAPADLQGIGVTLSAANATASSATTGLLVAGADEVSLAAAAVFGRPLTGDGGTAGAGGG
ncbi:PE family protein [Mycobacterium basiliense]|uniref:PE family protein n=2 Tax=Mycobacterium basiliense TaxID=2094119 RepID=A0A3S4BDP3_9MYCO|nr:PE family protein [Mycobacterium basiliense]